MIKFAQFGAGFIGKIHGKNIARHPKAELAYIYDVNMEAAEQLAAQLGAKVAASPEEIWSADVHAFMIASSTNTHADLLIGAIGAGKSIYCEKPIDLDINRVKDVKPRKRTCLSSLALAAVLTPIIWEFGKPCKTAKSAS